MSVLLSPVLDSKVPKPVVVRHKRVSRPGEGSLTPSKTSGSMPSRDRSTVSPKARYASQNFSCPPRDDGTPGARA